MLDQVCNEPSERMPVGRSRAPAWLGGMLGRGGAEVKKCLSPTSLAQGRGFQGPPVESSGPVADEQLRSCAARHMSIKHVV